MVEKSPAKKKSTASARQQMLDTFAETAKAVEERKDADAGPRIVLKP